MDLVSRSHFSSSVSNETQYVTILKIRVSLRLRLVSVTHIMAISFCKASRFAISEMILSSLS